MRYPGSKRKHAKTLLEYIPTDVKDWSEPFAGGLAITLEVAKRQPLERIVINDLDYGIYALWLSIVNDIEELTKRIDSYIPRAEDFYEFKNNPNTGDPYADGFRKLALHQISYSGMGGMAGSPIGGKNQTGAYKVDCRWSPKRLRAWAESCNKLLNRSEVVVKNGHWKEASDAEFVYYDPPYYAEGGGLYIHGSLDHKELADYLAERESGWLLSYDEHPEIRNLYDFANVRNYPVISHLHHKKVEDVIITPFDNNCLPFPTLD